MEFAVLLTACINPNRGGKVDFLTRTDPHVRLQDYQTALRFWLNNDDKRIRSIVFIDNSGFSLETIQQIAASENPHGRVVEVLSINDNYYPPGVEYGYAELNMLDYVLEHSEQLKQCSHFIKATGRLTFPRISRLLDRLPQDFDFAVDARNIRIGKRERRSVTTQIALFKVDFYRQILAGIKTEMSPEFYSIETLFFKHLMPYRGRAGCVLRFPVNCEPSGMAAHFNKNYDSRSQRAAQTLRGLGRVFFPGVWF